MITVVVCIWAGHDGNIYKCKNGHEIMRLSCYETVPYAFKVNYHTDSWETVSSECKCRTYSKYRAVKPRNFIGLELVVNEIISKPDKTAFCILANILSHYLLHVIYSKNKYFYRCVLLEKKSRPLDISVNVFKRMKGHKKLIICFQSFYLVLVEN